VSAPARRDAGSAIDGFASYRRHERRAAHVARRGLRVPFLEARDGVSGSTIVSGGREMISYSGYNYLGLSGHPAVSRAAKDAIDRHGTSASASRIVSGQIPLHAELEKRLAAFLGTDDCLVFVSGYLTNVSAIGHLFAPRDVVAHDAMAHHSIVAGARLARARVVSYPRHDWMTLDARLEPVRGQCRRGLLVAEGIYSMDGCVVDMAGALRAKRRHRLLLMVDEAHSLGILGRTGRGVGEAFALTAADVEIRMGTLSKALASCGGYIAGDRGLIEYLRYMAPGFVFSVGLTPPDTAAALAALEILECEPDRPRQVRDRARQFRSLARRWGLSLGGDEDAPIAALVVGDADRCIRLSERLAERGVHVPPIVYPGVPWGAARLRFFITIGHTEAQFRATLPVVAQELERLGPGLDG
jgi:8-amino-7-oxononanoate synthase